jgi:CelD/BcsL family acetyltransferase involved in cellulose biosynthesis
MEIFCDLVRIETMVVLAIGARRLGAGRKVRVSDFRVEFVADWREAVSRWCAGNAPTPFQDGRWLGAWYQAFAACDDVEPLIALLTEAATSEKAMLLPLVRRSRNGIHQIEFADLDLTDYNGPLLGPAAPRDAATARALWRDLVKALKRLPGGADLIRFRKLPIELAGRPNPLALLDGTSRCAVNGNVVVVGEDFDVWRYSLEKTVRKGLERSWRVFARHEGAAFQIVTEQAAAERALAAMAAQQDARMRHLGLNFTLNEKAYAAFYGSLVSQNLGNGYVVVSTLTVGEEVVATLLGIRNGANCVMVRSSNAGERWSNCSPGRLIIERTMAALHKDGVRSFDFSTGNYAYKRRFGVKRVPLLNKTKALTWRGMPYELRDRAVRELRRYPHLSLRVSRALGTQSAREEE